MARKLPAYCPDCGFDFDAELEQCRECGYCRTDCICRDDSPLGSPPLLIDDDWHREHAPRPTEGN